MPASGSNTKIESTAAVTEGRARFPIGLCCLGVLRPAISQHRHSPQMREGICILSGCGEFEELPGDRRILIASKPVQIHEAEIELGCRQPCVSSPRIIGPRILQIGMRAAAMLQQHAKIVRCARMAAVGRLPQKPGGRIQPVPTTCLRQQVVGTFKKGLRIAHDGDLAEACTTPSEASRWQAKN